jgi:hypothetical protein
MTAIVEQARCTDGASLSKIAHVIENAEAVYIFHHVRTRHYRLTWTEIVRLYRLSNSR